MGYYIEAPRNKGKANWLVGAHGAVRVSQDRAEDALAEGQGVVCVVDNGPFEAAGFCFDENEFRAFSHPDGRPREWLVMDRDLAEKLSGYRREGQR